MKTRPRASFNIHAGEFSTFTIIWATGRNFGKRHYTLIVLLYILERKGRRRLWRREVQPNWILRTLQLSIWEREMERIFFMFFSFVLSARIFSIYIYTILSFFHSLSLSIIRASHTFISTHHYLRLFFFFSLTIINQSNVAITVFSSREIHFMFVVILWSLWAER